MNCKSRSVSSKPGNFPYSEQLRSYWRLVQRCSLDFVVLSRSRAGVLNASSSREVALSLSLPTFKMKLRVVVTPHIWCQVWGSVIEIRKVGARSRDKDDGIDFLILGVVSCFQQGVIFEGGRDVLLTDSHWRVTSQYNLTQIEEESRNLSILVTEWAVGTQKLLISKDRLMYSMYNQLEFERECRGEQLIVCPLSNVLLSVSKRPNSAVEMFHYEQVRLCGRKLISGLRSPVRVKTPSRWIYSASEEHILTLNCLTSYRTVNITSAVVKGVGEFRGIDMCDVVSEVFKVPARIHGSSVFRTDK
ncbi:hypothetical protein J6590_070319 [Homalodisca vitripennis]|nr:hypothetical protein J6590_070319 [Homalodisca vitripennis]